MPQGVVISDLHLFAKRTDESLIENTLEQISEKAEFLVLNGDIFDFRWSQHATTNDTISAAVDWLHDLKKALPNCHIHYIMGNHDCSQQWAEALEQIDKDRFFWSPTHFKIGRTLFLHGDLPLEGRNPFHRELVENHERMFAYPVMDFLYETVVQTRIHNLTSLLGTPNLCAPRIHTAITAHEPEYLDDVKHIYFGHTHVPFSGYEFKGISFYNTGSGIKYMKINKMDILHEQ